MNSKSAENNFRRWRPRYSVRTILLAVSFVAAYFGCWDLTQRFGVLPPGANGDDSLHVADERSPMPFVIRGEQLEGGCILYRAPVYYVWFLGPRIRLPLDRWVQPNSTNEIYARWEDERPVPVYPAGE